MIQMLVRLLIILTLSLSVISCASPDSQDNEMDEEVSAALDEESEDDGFDDDDSEDVAEEDAEGDDDGFEDEEDDELAEGDDFDEDSGEDDLNEEGSDAEQIADEDEDELEPEELENEPEVEEQVAEAEGATLEEDLQGVDPSSEQVAINNISYKANQSGGTVVVDLSGSPTYQTRVNSETNQFVVEISNASLPEQLKRPLITNEFNSSIKGVNAYQSPGSQTARIVVQMTSAQEPMVQLEGQSLLIIPSGSAGMQAEAEESAEEMPNAPVDQGQQEQQGEFSSAEKWSYDTNKAKSGMTSLKATSLEEYLRGSTEFYGRRISLETTKDADIRDVLRFISEQSGVNMVISDSVKGTVQLKLRQVAWDQAFLIVLRTKRLGYIRQGNVLRISTLDELELEAASAKKVIEASKSLEPLRVKVIPVSYAIVADLVKQVKPFLTAKRGEVVDDRRTSSLIIKDTDDIIKKVSRLVKELDVPPAQVMIEGKIVEASEQFSDAMGVNWGSSGDSVTISESGGSNGTPINFRGSFQSAALNTTTTTAGAGLLSLKISQLKGLGALNLRLALEESKNNVKIISSPRIMAINKEKASIEQKGEVFSKVKETDAQSGDVTESLKRLPFKLRLDVTPQITSAGSVIMDVEMLREFPGAVDVGAGEAPLNAREAKTKILVNNNQTAVIGGIFQNDQTSSKRGVPILKDIPLLGWLFKSNLETNTKTELLIFLTPRVINQMHPGSLSTEPIVIESAKSSSMESVEESSIEEFDEDDEEDDDEGEEDFEEDLPEEDL